MNDQKTVIDNAPKAQRLPEREERKVTLSNLTERQKGLLGAAGAGVAGISLGVVAMSLMGAAESTAGGEVNPPVIPGTGTEDVEVTIYTDAPFAEGVNDSMSFGEAFRTARADVGAGGIFEWHGKLYNTYLKEEWAAMDKSERAEFFASIDKDFLPGDEEKETEIINIVNDTEDTIDDNEDIVILDDDGPDNLIPTDDGDDEIVIVDTEEEDLIIEDEPVVVDGGNGIGINPDVDVPDLYDDDIIITDEA
jgi:hypothetical protein